MTRPPSPAFSDRTHASSGEVTRHPLRAATSFPLTAAARVNDRIVDVVVADGTLIIDGVAMPLVGTAVDLLIHPQLPVAWLALFPGLFGQAEIVRIDLVAGSRTTVVTPNRFSKGQFADLDGDGTLELLVSREPTLVLDGATGALLDKLPGVSRFATDEEGNLVPATLGPQLDLDGNGVVDQITGEAGTLRLTVADDAFSLPLGIAESVFPGPGRREVTVYTELRGTTTWPLLCDD